MSPNLERAKEIFRAAAERSDPADRAAYLDHACGGEAALRQQVEGLLQKHEHADALPELPAAGQTAGFSHGDHPESPDPRPAETPTESVGDRIGLYKLLQKLGEGGMGTVWVAEQTEPVKRRVALKLIKPGMDSSQVLRRFEAERQALALMDHTNIAKVLDAGATGGGRPYFVMELVQGVPVTRYCDELHLSVRERLALFVPVCQAIQHAHQKGIIHRDVKPSNVLVCMQDGRPVPKVIDFGVAKALHQRLGEESIYTEIGAIVGTLEYMSPEQAEMSPLGVDTRADVYALGVLLYELLTGFTPLDRQRLRRAAYSEAVRLIKEETPSKPSTRLTQSSATLANLAVLRRTEPGNLARLLRGELDWIAMKCLEKDRTRRYETADALARDVERFLADEPVEACPPSAGYRLVKFVRRHKGPALAGASLLLLLVAGIAGTSWGMIQAERARRAEFAQRELAVTNEEKALAAAAAEKEAKETAQTREAETRAVLDFVENKIFAAARPEGQEGGQGFDVTLRQALESALPFVETSFQDQPLIDARLRNTLGLSFSYLGKANIAAEQYQSAWNNYAQHLGAAHPETLRSMHGLADSYHDLGRYAEALKLNEEVLALRRANLGAGHPDTLQSMNAVARSYHDVGRDVEAIKLCEETLTLRKAKLGPDHIDTLQSMTGLAICYNALNRRGDALRLREETLVLSRSKLGTDHPATLSIMFNLANSYASLGRYADALKLREEGLALRKAKLGPDHPSTLDAMSSLANSYLETGRYTEALKLHDETLALYKAKLGAAHPRTLLSMYNIACCQALLVPTSADRRKQADLAMEWLKRAFDGGYNNVAELKHDKDIDVLRGRADFRKLLAEVESRQAKDQKQKQ